MMNERILQDAIFQLLFDLRNDQGKQKFFFITPNVNLFGWESDLIAKDDKERIFEFELKTSRSDFLKDLKKKRNKQLIDPEIKKKPNLFYYVLPMDSVKLSEVPNFAGVYFYRTFDCPSRGLVVNFFLKRKSIVLSKYKASLKDCNKLLTSVYFKFWRQRTGKSTKIRTRSLQS